MWLGFFCLPGRLALTAHLLFFVTMYQLYMFFLMWRFQKRLEHYSGMKGPFYGGEYSRCGRLEEHVSMFAWVFCLHVLAAPRNMGVLWLIGERGHGRSVVASQVLMLTLFWAHRILQRMRTAWLSCWPRSDLFALPLNGWIS